MPLSPAFQARLKALKHVTPTETTTTGKHGVAIFNGSDQPRSWEEFHGQTLAVQRLRAAISTVRKYGGRLDHILLSSGLHGAGKSTLARLIAFQMEVGIAELSGKVSVDDARDTITGMADNDVLFLDEAHSLVGSGKSAEWLLTLLQDGGLMTRRGFEPMPSITVIAATTDAGRLPQTILSRFPIQPVLEPYSADEAAAIAHSHAARLGMSITDEEAAAVAAASNRMPREMRTVLSALRDSEATGERSLATTLDWLGLTPDGLSRVARDYLLVLFLNGGTCGERTISMALSEPGPLLHTERLLVQTGLITIEARGRTLTDAGAARVLELSEDL